MTSPRFSDSIQVAMVIRKVPAMSQGDNEDQMCTLVSGVTGISDVEVVIEAITSLIALLELDEKSLNVFSHSSKIVDLSEVELNPPDTTLNLLFLINEAVFEDIKKALSTRSRSSILEDPHDPFYRFVKNF